MATKLFLRDTTNNGISNYRDMTTTAGSSIKTKVVNTSAGGTEIQWTDGGGGANIAWVSGYVTAPFTLTLTDVDLWCQENNGSANAGPRYRVFKRDLAGVETELTGGPFDDGVEFNNMSATSATWSGNVGDTAFAINDRIVVKFYITNIGTMGGGFTATMSYDAADAATGDSFFNINENVTFSATPVTSIKTVAGLAVASVKTMAGLAIASVKDMAGLS